MESEELRLLRENNQMLKEIIWYLKYNGNNRLADFVVNVLADKVAENI